MVFLLIIDIPLHTSTTRIIIKRKALRTNTRPFSHKSLASSLHMKFYFLALDEKRKTYCIQCSAARGNITQFNTNSFHSLSTYISPIVLQPQKVTHTHTHSHNHHRHKTQHTPRTQRHCILQLAINRLNLHFIDFREQRVERTKNNRDWLCTRLLFLV